MKIFVAMSGGVDSAVAALLLQREGHELVGIHLRTGVQAEPAAPDARPRCCGADEAADARRVCGLLGIPFFVQNTERDFRGLIDDFAASYARGETPNPCIACNNDIKFGALLERARALGATAVATGHYARRVRYGEGWAIARARDADKDQSYVLCGLRQDELAAVRFPLGDLVKDEVRALAAEAGLPVAQKRESQDICFVPQGDYRTIVKDLRPDAFVPGDIVDQAGRVRGQHDGIGGFTVGQRKGLGIGGAEPLYVRSLDAATRQVVVAPRRELGFSEIELADVRWSAIASPREPRAVTVMLRYRATPLAGLIVAREGAAAHLAMKAPAWPVTPGQAAVFYDGEVLLGGGRITSCS